MAAKAVREALEKGIVRDSQLIPGHRPVRARKSTVQTGDTRFMKKLVLEAETLSGLVAEAEAFLAECKAPAGTSGEAAPAKEKKPKGHATKMQEAQDKANVEEKKEPAKEPAGAKVSKEAFYEAVNKLIDGKGEETAARVLRNYSPAARFSLIPESRWHELVAEVAFLFEPKEDAPAKEAPKNSLI